MRSAVDFLPSIRILLTSWETRTSPYTGSLTSGRCATGPLRGMAYFSFLTPWRERACLRSLSPCVSSAPRTRLEPTRGRDLPGASRARVLESFGGLSPASGISPETSLHEVRRTRATRRGVAFLLFLVVVLPRL